MTAPVTAVLCTYGDTWQPWLPACLETLATVGQVTTMVLVTDRVHPEHIAWANQRNVSLAAVRLDGTEDRGVQFTGLARSAVLAPAARIAGWRRALQLVAPGSRFVALDVDTLVLSPLDDLFAQGEPPYFHLGTVRQYQRSGYYRYRTAVVAGVATPMVDRYLDDWIRTLHRYEHQALKLTELYGSVESGAWYHLTGQAADSGGLVLGALPPLWCMSPTELKETTRNGGVPVGLVHFDRIPPDPETHLSYLWLAAKRDSGL